MKEFLVEDQAYFAKRLFEKINMVDHPDSKVMIIKLMLRQNYKQGWTHGYTAALKEDPMGERVGKKLEKKQHLRSIFKRWFK